MTACGLEGGGAARRTSGSAVDGPASGRLPPGGVRRAGGPRGRAATPLSHSGAAIEVDAPTRNSATSAWMAAGQVAQLKMDVVLKGHEPRLGLVQAGYRTGSGLADLFEACCLGLQLLERLFVHPPEHVRFTVQRFFERSDALIDVLSAGRLNCFLILLPLMKREAEPIQLGFETGKTLLEIGIIVIHRKSVRMIHKPIVPVTRFCRSHPFAA